MNKYSVDPECFKQIDLQAKVRYEWVGQLRPKVEKIINFGCWESDEPFALLWTLDASEIVVIEKEEIHLIRPKQRLKTLNEVKPLCMDGRSVEFITADMSEKVAELPSDYFDLAFCENVLYNLHEPYLKLLQQVVHEISRIVVRGGWIVAVEPKIGAKFEKTEIAGITFHNQVSEPINISSLFEEIGMVKFNLETSPRYTYCYLKPHS
jgi:SAM-dependent methyltransferase